MKRHMELIAIVAAISVILLLPVVASAVPVTYTYIGNPFNDFTDHDPPVGAYDENNNVEVMLTTIDGVLPDTYSLEDVSDRLASWSFTDGRYTVHDTMDVGHLNLKVKLSEGIITSWVLGVEFNLALPADVDLPGSGIKTENSYYLIKDYGGLRNYSPSSSFTADEGWVEDNPGEWSSTAVNPVPEPTTIFLLGSGLVGLAGFRRKFKKA